MRAAIDSRCGCFRRGFSGRALHFVHDAYVKECSASLESTVCRLVVVLVVISQGFLELDRVYDIAVSDRVKATSMRTCRCSHRDEVKEVVAGDIRL